MTATADAAYQGVSGRDQDFDEEGMVASVTECDDPYFQDRLKGDVSRAYARPDLRMLEHATVDRFLHGYVEHPASSGSVYSRVLVENDRLKTQLADMRRQEARSRSTDLMWVSLIWAGIFAIAGVLSILAPVPLVHPIIALLGVCASIGFFWIGRLNLE